MRILFLLLCLGTAMAAQTARGALFNPRISSRSIALNQPVRITFTTIPAQLPEVDIVSTVRSALALPDARSRWRLYGTPSVEVHDRLHTIEVGFVLLPRISGSLQLPEIPVRWLEGEQLARFGQVVVADGIAVGAEQRQIPRECTEVAGVPWTADPTVLKNQFGAPEEVSTEPVHILRFQPEPNLIIETQAGRLSQVRVDTPQLRLEDARHQLVERWGEPILDRVGKSLPSQAQLLWHIGWLRIEGYPQEDGMRVVLVREDVASDILANHVQQSLFRLLEGRAE